MNMIFQLPEEAAQQAAQQWQKHIEAVREWKRTQTVFKHWPFPVAVFAIAGDINMGYYLAIKSGMHHRVPHRLWAYRVCNSPTLSVVSSEQTASEWATGPVSEEELAHDYEPYWLGEHPAVLFDNKPLSRRPLFVYPENFVVPKQEREIVDRLMDRTDVEEAVIITKSPMILSDFINDCISVWP